ncbi:MAG: hypothetical protein QG609_4 [Patescibacteria group bacterium]|nr:hypothetical protein [Patescibacteria group bacterium]
MRYIYILLFTLFLIVSVAITPSASAQATVSANVTLEAQIAELLKQVEALQAQIKTLENTNTNLESELSQLRLEAGLRVGSSGEDVRLLQKLLATDPTVYPEGLVTGLFGPLTENAVKRFQAKFKLDQIGTVGPQTLARINEILWAAGVTGDIPNDLLGSRVKIEVEVKNGKQEVKIEVKCDSSGQGNICNDDDEEDESEDENELGIEVEIEEGVARVDVEQKGDESRFILNLTDHSAIIAELSTLLGLNESEIESVIEFEDDVNEDDEDDQNEEDDEDEDEDEESEDNNEDDEDEDNKDNKDNDDDDDDDDEDDVNEDGDEDDEDEEDESEDED